MKISLAVVSDWDVVLFAATILIVFVLLVALFFTNAWIQKYQVGSSPYSKLPLRRCIDLPYGSAEKILRYLYDLYEYDNRIFDLKYAAFCRETGRIFPNCINWMGIIRVDWTFLQKRFPGSYVSWGSLTESQQIAIRDMHYSLEGFQTEVSSPTPSPRLVEHEYAFTRPGPLYIDPVTKVLVGWKQVPGTTFEVLIVQRPPTNYRY